MVSEFPIVIPSLEPDNRLLVLLKDLHTNEMKDVILVDDGSAEQYRPYFETAQKEYGYTVLRHAVNLGKGRALKTAFNYLLNREIETGIPLCGCITADSDGQHTCASVQSCMDALQEYPENLILGCRNFDDPSVPWRSRCGNKLTRRMFQLLIGLKVTDTQTGLRAISKKFMMRLLSISGERFEFETNMLIETKSQNISITEVPIATVYDSKENHATHFHFIRDSIKIYSIFGKFIFSSLSSSIVDLLLFSLLVPVFNPISTQYVFWATCLARVISATYNYFINYSVVFHSNAKHRAALLRYFILAAIQMCCSALLVSIFASLLGGYETVIKVFVDIGLFFISYQIQREFVYKKEESK